MNSEKKILCTIGPSSLNERTLKKFEKEGVWLFRINLSHTKYEDLQNVILTIRKYSNVPISLDTEGAQIRTGYLPQKHVFLEKGSEIFIRLDVNNCKGNDLVLNYREIIDEIESGDIIFLDFDSAAIQVIEKIEDDILCRVLISGRVGSNKAVNLQRNIKLPFLTEKDKKSIKLGRELGIKHFALSFAQNGKSVKNFRDLIGNDSFLISKIESNSGLKNLNEIIGGSDAILVDRGDLSREQDISKIPFWQKDIISKVKENKKQVFIATNLLETMIENKLPTRAEMNDIASILFDGGDGLVLAAETAIGEHPIASVRILKNIISQYLKFKANKLVIFENDDFNLIKPIGGALVLVDEVIEDNFKNSFPKVNLNKFQFLDFLQIAEGGFSPLNGFMGTHEIESVLKNNIIRDNIIWPIPVILQIDKTHYDNLTESQEVALYYGDKFIGTITISEKFNVVLDDYCMKLFGTNDDKHPGVKLIKSMGKYVIAGKIKKSKDITFNTNKFEMTPRQTRKVFTVNGWKEIVGFHGRNIPHNGHIYIQKYAYDKVHADGLFINPVSTKVRETDFNIEDIIRSYSILEKDLGYRGYNIFYSSLAYYPRFAGPREALFTALIRQNYGCSHFIIGRDHTGVGGYYTSEMFEKYINSVKDKIGIEIILVKEAYYCSKCEKVTMECEHDSKYHIKISGTKVREMIENTDRIDFRIVNKKVLKGLMNE